MTFVARLRLAPVRETMFPSRAPFFRDRLSPRAAEIATWAEEKERSMSDERFLITGALGCIGAWSCAQLVREDLPVILYDLGTNMERLELIMSPDELEQLTL